MDVTTLFALSIACSRHAIICSKNVFRTLKNQKRLDIAYKLLERARFGQVELVKQQQLWRNALGFNAAVPVEPLDTCIDIKIPPTVHTVMATDGSQMTPSHHEIAYCYQL